MMTEREKVAYLQYLTDRREDLEKEITVLLDRIATGTDPEAKEIDYDVYKAYENNLDIVNSKIDDLYS